MAVFSNENRSLNEGVKKWKCLSSQKHGRKRIHFCFVRKPKMVRQADNFIRWRINRETAFTELFTSDKNPELRIPRVISIEIKRK
jgi:hypothetical protein